ncbi:hypothetical protein C8J57DRAFT_1668287 [Mycena rebaudengoi]|nr:hypothetical protein C8J57DRAFT_1668287 [Mycena rebaudengoi]
MSFTGSKHPTLRIEIPASSSSNSEPNPEAAVLKRTLLEDVRQVRPAVETIKYILKDLKSAFTMESVAPEHAEEVPVLIVNYSDDKCLEYEGAARILLYLIENERFVVPADWDAIQGQCQTVAKAFRASVYATQERRTDPEMQQIWDRVEKELEPLSQAMDKSIPGGEAKPNPSVWGLIAYIRNVLKFYTFLDPVPNAEPSLEGEKFQLYSFLPFMLSFLDGDLRLGHKH